VGRILRLIAFMAAVALAALFVIPSLARMGIVFLWPVLNRVETGRTPEYPDLQPLTVALSPARVFEAALTVARTLPRWTVVKADPASGRAVVRRHDAVSRSLSRGASHRLSCE